jgi:hypothetical protein
MAARRPRPDDLRLVFTARDDDVTEVGMAYPFDRSGTEVGPDDIRRYTGLPQNLPQTLRRVDDAVAQLNRLTARGIDTIVAPIVWGPGTLE